MKFKVAGLLILVAIAMQLIPYGKDHSNPAVVAEPTWDSPKTRDLFFIACADCHSNETVWPWYSKIAPVSWLVQSDVAEGREYFNVSMWGVQHKNEGEEAAEKVDEGEMPPWLYLIPRPAARFSENQKAEFIRGLVATFRSETKEERHEDDYQENDHEDDDEHEKNED